MSMETCCPSCPNCHQDGRVVSIITLKTLLKPTALSKLHPDVNYSFCSTPDCDVVYFSETNTFKTQDLKVPVFQKDNRSQVPVCYCFGWTRERLIHAVKENRDPVEQIRKQVRENRCGCEVNNPQGACCLGNVTFFLRGIGKK